MRALLLSLLFAPTVAQAAPVTLTIRGQDGKPIAGAVVQLRGTRRGLSAGALAAAYTVAQRDIAFQPALLLVPVGASVRFPNFDKVRHHVYSFSPAKRFELKLYGRQETRSVTFDTPGVVALGCNIHDSMAGFIVVVDTPFAAVTDARGQVAFADVPVGAASVQVWSPGLRAPGNMIAQPATVPAQGLVTTLTLRR